MNSDQYHCLAPKILENGEKRFEKIIFWKLHIMSFEPVTSGWQHFWKLNVFLIEQIYKNLSLLALWRNFHSSIRIYKVSAFRNGMKLNFANILQKMGDGFAILTLVSKMGLGLPKKKRLCFSIMINILKFCTILESLRFMWCNEMKKLALVP